MLRLSLNRLFFGLCITAGSAGLLGCSQYSNRAVNRGYHNLTARYNAYVLARDKVNVVDRTLFKTRQENYNRPLPVLLPIDSVTTQAVRPLLDSALRQASLVPSRHQNSRWVDDAYNLIGRIRLYRQELPEAIEVFKYVNTKGKNADDKHEALVGLMRAYVETGDYTNALNVAEFLRAQPLNRPNTRTYYLTKAYLHQKRGEWATAAGLLDAALPLMRRNERRARLHLIAGQLYDQAGQPDKAAGHYAAVRRNRPNYEQTFYASLYNMQQTGSQRSGRTASFEQLLNDRKNVDLKDKLYYTMALLDSRAGRYEAAIANYQQSIRTTTTNTAQIPYTYLELGRLYFDKKRDFVRAKMYYDSALLQLPPQSAEFAAVTARKQVLDEFVDNFTLLQREDSLQRLAQLNPAALDQRLDQLLDAQLAAEKAQAEQALKAANQPANLAGATNSDLAPDQRWVLYNPIQQTQGRLEFQQRWGNRPLEDNWRRSNRAASAAQPGDTNPLSGTSPADAVNPAPPITGNPLSTPANPATVARAGDPATAARKLRKDAMYAALPLTRDALHQSNVRMEQAYYRMGKLYKVRLNQPTDAITTFERLLGRFPNTTYKPEVYYLLHLAHEQLNRPSDWKAKLLTEFPTTSYARLASRSTTPAAAGAPTAGAPAGLSMATPQVQQAYTEVYALYQQGNFTEALNRADALMPQATGTPVDDKLALLRALLIGKVRGVDAYRTALIEFIRDYPASPLVERAEELRAVTEQSTAKRK